MPRKAYLKKEDQRLKVGKESERLTPCKVYLKRIRSRKSGFFIYVLHVFLAALPYILYFLQSTSSQSYLYFQSLVLSQTLFL